MPGRLDLTPPLADRFIVGVAPIDYGPVLLLMPFGFHLTVDTLPSGEPPTPLRPARHYPRFWIWRSSSERPRDFNPPEQRAAQRTQSPDDPRFPAVCLNALNHALILLLQKDGTK